ncbi:MAG: amino acid aminotransferase [Pirellulaceae bacterium]|nr:amino acid aminotransferase [Pirellulaceae bacterium]MDP6557835.1 amino acid aminotransferase [Pirellulaceae bacterium]
MFEHLDTAPPDAILGLNVAFQSDPNPDKINLGVGVYKDATGQTPVLDCVKAAEQRLVDQEASKSYLAIDGLPQFGQLTRELLFGVDHEIVKSGRSVSLQTPGGTGALRVAADFLRKKLPAATVWCSKPTWVNHPKVFAAADCQIETYEYIDAAGVGLDFEAMLGSLQEIPSGDVVLLHGCCHNPTGIDPTPQQWKRIGDVVRQRALLPLIDLAYQGFGESLETDVRGLHEVCRDGTEAIVCSSFSKNFGLYSERVGALTLIADEPAAAAAALSHAKVCVRTNYSNPPQHGAAIVAAVLSDSELRAQWEQELTVMRDRINSMRALFVEAMRDKAPGHDFSFIAAQNGMFSFSGLSPMQVDELRNKHSVYVVTAGGRINVAGITPGNMDRLCTAIADVL